MSVCCALGQVMQRCRSLQPAGSRRHGATTWKTASCVLTVNAMGTQARAHRGCLIRLEETYTLYLKLYFYFLHTKSGYQGADMHWLEKALLANLRLKSNITYKNQIHFHRFPPVLSQWLCQVTSVGTELWVQPQSGCSKEEYGIEMVQGLQGCLATEFAYNQSLFRSYLHLGSFNK